MEFPREDRIMVRIIDLDHPKAAPYIQPLARVGLSAEDIAWIIKRWDAGEYADIGGYRYERVQ